MTQFKIKAGNIKCGGCVTIIKNGLTELPEVETVDVDINDGEVTVTANIVKQTTIEQKLNDLGYPVK